MSLELEQERALGRLVDYPHADDLGEWFARAGHELHLVGGPVRDALLGRQRRLRDLDFATSAAPEESRRILVRWADAVWDTGARFGTISARKGPWRIEVTTYRAERYVAGSRHPQVTYGSDLEEDLARRDFTINAMAVRVPDRRFVDPFGGLADLRGPVLRTPLDPATSFGDDPLRMVRLARFAAELEADVDAPAEAAASALAAALDTISRERIRDELSRLVCAPSPQRGLDLLCRTALAERFLPELPALRMELDPEHHHKDVYAHTVAVVVGVPQDDVVLRLAALLHDVGKPRTRSLLPGGKVAFHHHEVVGARMARTRLKELRYGNDVVDAVEQLVLLHLRFHGYADGEWTDGAVRRLVRDCGTPEQLRRLTLLTKADITTQHRGKARRLRAAVDDFAARVTRLAEQEELDRLRPALDGHRIMAHLGIPPGPLVGEAWAHLKELRVEQGPMTDEQGVAALDAWAQARGIEPRG